MLHLPQTQTVKKNHFTGLAKAQFLETVFFFPLLPDSVTTNLHFEEWIIYIFFFEWAILKFLCICSPDVLNSHMDTVNCFCNARKSSKSFYFAAGAAFLKGKMYEAVCSIKTSSSLSSQEIPLISIPQVSGPYMLPKSICLRKADGWVLGQYSLVSQASHIRYR